MAFSGWRFEPSRAHHSFRSLRAPASASALGALRLVLLLQPFEEATLLFLRGGVMLLGFSGPLIDGRLLGALLFIVLDPSRLLVSRCR